MSKNKKRSPEDFLRDFDPAVDKLAMDRLFGGKQLFDHRTHRLKRHIRDEGQARAVLLRAIQLAKTHHKNLALRYLERRLLDQAFDRPATDQWVNQSLEIIADDGAFAAHFVQMLRQAKSVEILTEDKLEQLRKIFILVLIAGVLFVWIDYLGDADHDGIPDLIEIFIK